MLFHSVEQAGKVLNVFTCTFEFFEKTIVLLSFRQNPTLCFLTGFNHTLQICFLPHP